MADMVSERYALSLYEVAQDEKQEKLYLCLLYTSPSPRD